MAGEMLDMMLKAAGSTHGFNEAPAQWPGKYIPQREFMAPGIKLQ